MQKARPSDARPSQLAVATLVFAGLGLAACHRGALKGDRGASDAGANPTDAEAGSPGPSVSPDATSDPPPVSTDGGIDLGSAASDAGADGADPNRDLDQLVEDLTDVFYGRVSACFNAPRARLPSGDVPGIPAYAAADSVRLGLIKVDPEATRHCLETLMTASCDRIAAISLEGPLGPGNPALPECAGVVAGQVPSGGSCLVNADCQSSEQYACVGNNLDCAGVCVPRTLRAEGDHCDDATDRCPDGTFCVNRPENINDQRCLRPIPEGGPCGDFVGCGSGLVCVPLNATSIDGTCRPLALGSPCTGNWDCAVTYVCAGADMNHPGTCQVGKPVGATCTTSVRPVLGTRYTDCAENTYCLDLDGHGPRCVGGAPLHARCETLPCLEGYCAVDRATDPPVATCQPTKPAGSPCDDSYGECTPPNQCLTRFGGSVCGQPGTPLPIGSLCHFNGDCGNGEYCAPPANFSPDVDPEIFGTCAPLIPIGGSCRPHLDRCAGLAECMNGVCQRC